MILFGIFLCLVLSAFLSLAEMAFVSCNKLRVRRLAGEGKRPAQIIQGMQRDVRKFLASILVGNNLVNVTATALATYFFETRLGIQNEAVVLAFMAPFFDHLGRDSS